MSLTYFYKQSPYLDSSRCQRVFLPLRLGGSLPASLDDPCPPSVQDILGVGARTLPTCLVASRLKETDEPCDKLALTVEQAGPNPVP